jgi:hypothetical protein
LYGIAANVIASNAGRRSDGGRSPDGTDLRRGGLRRPGRQPGPPSPCSGNWRRRWSARPEAISFS